MPFSALAGIDLNGDANNTDYVPGTTRNMFNRGRDEEAMARVNAFRAQQPSNALNPNGFAPISASQIASNEYYSLDMRATKTFVVNDRNRFEVSLQVFNLLNRTNLLPVWTTNALSSVFGTITSASNMRQAEVVVRYAW
jgi:hypothetical protein